MNCEISPEETGDISFLLSYVAEHGCKSIQKRIQNVKKVTRIKERTLVNIE